MSAFHREYVLGEWRFTLARDDHETVYLSVPDQGGMADGVARVPEQLVWAEREFATVAGLERVWVTSWRVPESALTAVDALLKQHGAIARE